MLSFPVITMGALAGVFFIRTHRYAQLEKDYEDLQYRLSIIERHYHDLFHRTEGIFITENYPESFLDKLEAHFYQHECQVEINSIKAIFYYWQHVEGDDTKISRLPVQKYHQFIRWADKALLIQGDAIQLRPPICKRVLIKMLGAEWVPF